LSKTKTYAKGGSRHALYHFVRDYWGIENGLHYRRDKTLHEDATRMKHPQQAAVMATINNLVIGLATRAGWRYLPEARRYYCGNLKPSA